MAFPTKGTRQITVDGVKYAWIASGNDGWIDLYFGLVGGKNKTRYAAFGYAQTLVAPDGSLLEDEPLIITPGIVRQIIQFGLQQGWDPRSAGIPFVYTNKAGSLRKV